MHALVKTFWDIALWRRSPGDLPDSVALLALTALVYAAMSALQSWMLHGTSGMAGRTLADLVLLAAPLWLLLRLARRAARYRQTLSALFGTGAVLSPFVILLLAIKTPAESSPVLGLLVWAGSVGIIVWYLFVMGFILRAALDTGMFTGVAMALAYVMGSAALLSAMFPGAT